MRQSEQRPLPAGIALAAFVARRSSSSLRVLGSAIGAITSALYLTVMLTMVTASLDPALNPGLNALLRLAESCIGTAVALLEVRLWPGAPSRALNNV